MDLAAAAYPKSSSEANLKGLSCKNTSEILRQPAAFPLFIFRGFARNLRVIKGKIGVQSQHQMLKTTRQQAPITGVAPLLLLLDPAYCAHTF